MYNSRLYERYSAAFEASFGYFERYIAYCTYLWAQRFEAGLFDRPQRKQALRICRIFPLGIVDAYFIYKFFAPDYMDDFEDDFEDEFEEDFFDDDDEEEYEDEEE